LKNALAKFGPNFRDLARRTSVRLRAGDVCPPPHLRKGRVANTKAFVLLPHNAFGGPRELGKALAEHFSSLDLACPISDRGKPT
jgi:hypothetical protein